MTYRDILDLMLSGCGAGGSPDLRAAELKYRLISEAERRLYSHLDIPEVFDRTAVSVTPDVDWIPTPPGVYSVQWIENKTGGHRLKIEPQGSLGRSQFFEAGTTRPPSGAIESVNFYWREGARIWLRDTPNEAGDLEIEFRVLPEKVTAPRLDEDPRLPEQYHVPMARIGQGVYYSLHPPLDPTTSTPLVSYGDSVVNAVLSEIAGTMKPPRAEENLAQRKYLYQPGYTMGGIR